MEEYCPHRENCSFYKKYQLEVEVGLTKENSAIVGLKNENGKYFCDYNLNETANCSWVTSLNNQGLIIRLLGTK